MTRECVTDSSIIGAVCRTSVDFYASQHISVWCRESCMVFEHAVLVWRYKTSSLVVEYECGVYSTVWYEDLSTVVRAPRRNVSERERQSRHQEEKCQRKREAKYGSGGGVRTTV
jgi:hypothetical protein